jgi:hypothetical protein
MVLASSATTALVNSSSTHSFIADTTARCLGLVLEPRSGLTDGVANGDRVASTGVCKRVQICIDRE